MSSNQSLFTKLPIDNSDNASIKNKSLTRNDLKKDYINVVDDSNATPQNLLVL